MGYQIALAVCVVALAATELRRRRQEARIAVMAIGHQADKARAVRDGRAEVRAQFADMLKERHPVDKSVVGSASVTRIEKVDVRLGGGWVEVEAESGTPPLRLTYCTNTEPRLGDRLTVSIEKPAEDVPSE